MKKFTSDNTTSAGPALAWFHGQMWVAFAGGGGLGAAAPNNILNVMPVDLYEPSDDWSDARKLVLDGEMTVEQPAIAEFNGALWLAWTGTDPAHHVNVMPLSFDAGTGGVTRGPKTVLDFTATGGPSLVTFENRLQLVFSNGGGFAGGRPTGELVVAALDNGGWHATVNDAYHSLLSPSAAVMPPYQVTRPTLWAAFTGTNNLLYAQPVAGDTRPGPVVSPIKSDNGGYYETSNYAPALSYDFINDIGPVLILTWTGFQNNRHLYQAAIEGSSTVHHYAVADTSAFAPSTLVQDGRIYVAWAGTDAAHRLNIADWTALPGIPS